MSKNSRPAWWFALSTLVVLAPLSAVAAEVAEPRLDTYATSDGTSYFALGLALNVTVPEAGSREVVILFDTSASQTSVFRDKALAALSTLLVSLPRGDRVHLMAVDLDAVPLTPKFVAPQGPEIDQAVAALKARVPLGATDMPVVLTAAADSFSKKSSAAKALVYIGDGMSTANFLEIKEFRALVDSLAALRVPVSSYAIGPRTDSQYLAALANQTGGMLAVDGDSVDPKQAGLFLASAIRGSVLWPTDSTWPSQFAEVYPTQTPPLRTDRETIVVGKLDGALEGDVKIAIEVENSGKRQTLDWSLAAEKPSEAFAFLPALVEMAHQDGGVRLVTVGHAGLEETRRILDENLQALVKLSSQAVITGNLDTAERLIAEALRRDPNDADALAVQKQLAKVRAGEKSAAAPEEKLQVKRSASEQAAPPTRTDSVKFKRPVEAIPPQPEPIDEVNDGEGRLLADIERQNKLISSLIRTEVEHELREARTVMGNNPAQAEQSLKLMLERVAQAPELKAEVRAQLRGQLETALRESSRRLATKEILDQQLEEARAGALDRLKIADALNRNQEKLKQLVDRFESLMDEGRYSAADELGSTEIPEVGPNEPVASSTATVAHLVGARAANLAQRNARAKAVVDTLATVEISFIPFPDDQPVVYPDAAAWEELTQRRKKYRSVDLKKFTPAEQKIRELLNKETAIPAYSGASLQDVADDLKDRLGIEIQLDLEHLKEDLPISIDTVELPEVKGMSLRAYLSLMKKRLPGLAWLIQDDMLLLTTKEVAESEENLIRKVYPVGDLVVPIMSSGGGMMGGGMGMMGGMGGGMGGMGGGGMGGMGGGMFSVPDDVPASAPNAWQAFAVPDDLKLTPKKTPAKADAPADKTNASPAKAAEKTKRAPAAKSAATPGAKAVTGKAAAKPSAIALKAPEGADLDQVWNDYFATHQEAKSDSVRQTARQLMHDRKYPELIAMIRAALRNGQPQPWMYEAMGLAMQAAGSPKGEIERALMSAVDFGDNTDDFMYVGQYMARSGLESRALKVFHQVAVVEPLRPEPYLYGLQLALRLNDLDGIRWSSLGILKQAWPRDKNHIVQTASRAAQDVVAQLKTKKRTAEAAEFQAELDKANVRDCLVKVTWTGDADVDILVEEPSGTICSFRTPRTTAGGVILGDAAARDTRSASSGSLSETYVCPEAFDGTYRVLIRKVWGKVTAGKVTVDVYAHYGSPEQKHLRDQVTLGDQDSLVTFDLTEGRRTEPLAEQQLANAAAGQVAVNQAVLAQQLGSLPGSQSAGINLAASRRGLIGIPFIQQAVGYMPVITTIPSGARLGISGVISADRRYVRVTPQPFFTQIGQVTTFNLQQGVTGTSSGGAQGGGGVGGGNPQPGGPPA